MGGLIPKNVLLERFAQFGRGEWDTLLIQSRDAAEEAAVARGRRRRTWVDSAKGRESSDVALQFWKVLPWLQGPSDVEFLERLQEKSEGFSPRPFGESPAGESSCWIEIVFCAILARRG